MITRSGKKDLSCKEERGVAEHQLMMPTTDPLSCTAGLDELESRSPPHDIT